MHVFNLTDFSNGKIKHVAQSLQEQDVHFFFPKCMSAKLNCNKKSGSVSKPLCVDLLGGVPELHLSQISLILLSIRGVMDTRDFIYLKYFIVSQISIFR